jgi:hypothetical protein
MREKKTRGGAGGEDRFTAGLKRGAVKRPTKPGASRAMVSPDYRMHPHRDALQQKSSEGATWELECYEKASARDGPIDSRTHSTRVVCIFLHTEFYLRGVPQAQSQRSVRAKSRMVAKGGIEPPTQGFSVLCSTN